MAKILLIEDDTSLGATLKENLELEGYLAQWAKTGEHGLAEIKNSPYDLVVLDVMLPDFSGLEVLAHLRQAHSLPVLMISAKGSAQDRIAGLELQADDYLPKPFHLKEFLLRVQALLRRGQQNQASSGTSVLKLGLAEIDLQGLTAKRASGETELLTPKEAGLLLLFYNNSNRVVSRETILSHVWGPSESPSTRTIDNIIVRLRKLIEPDPANPKWIISHRGVGYSLRTQNNESED